MIVEFFKAFLSMFVVMDVLGNVPLFWALSKKLKKEQKQKSIHKAVGVATILLIVFLFAGENILSFFSISIHSFKVAGGIIILIIGLQMVLGFKFREKAFENYNIAVVPLATPLITGPGVITTAIILVHSVGLWITLVASLLNLLITWLLLLWSEYIHNFMGRQGADVLSRVMGMILAALAVEFIKSGWTSII